jgi:hypothetical protein
MDQDTPMSNTGFGATSGSDFGTGAGGGSTSGGNLGGSSLNPGSNPSTDTDICPTCGQSKNRGLEQFLGRIGITEEMINNLKSQWGNVDVEEYLTTARDYLKDGGAKAGTYAKENPGKVAAGVAALALGAGLIYAATHRDRT